MEERCRGTARCDKTGNVKKSISRPVQWATLSLEAPPCQTSAYRMPRLSQTKDSTTLQEAWSASLPIASQGLRDVMNEVWLCFLGGRERLSGGVPLSSGGCDWVGDSGPLPSTSSWPLRT